MGQFMLLLLQSGLDLVNLQIHVLRFMLMLIGYVSHLGVSESVVKFNRSLVW